ncbi:MAG: hypothetical protein NC911_00480 [Candidatus Omnitrophica bacterium]|nr:hypothetical protein [Candidatus Omnitrophota bacterium]
MELKAGYVIEEETWKKTNQAGKNYWWTYLAEILDRLGLTGEAVHLNDLFSRLKEFSLLFLGPTEQELPSQEISSWVKKGGVLIGCCLQGLDGLFGNRFVKWLPEKEEFALRRFFLTPHFFTRGLVFPPARGKPLLAAGALRLVSPERSQLLALYHNQAVITSGRYGLGRTFYFGFDLAKTFWVIQQGRPVDRDYDGDGYLRTGDGIVIGQNDYQVPYTDILLFLLQNILRVLPFPLIHQLPPVDDGEVPDALFFFGGDDEATPGIARIASEFMRSLRLPYHINLMPDRNFKFALDRKEGQRLEKKGTEISLHYNFIDNFSHPVGFTENDVRKQTELFIRTFGKKPVCVNSHYLRWTGWYEPAFWMEKLALKGFNGKIHRRFPPLNPVNEIGFSFGTSFPFFYRADHKLRNKRIEFLDLPITAYEIGYLREQTDFPKLGKLVRLSSHYGLMMNVFYHPVYLAKSPACQAAVKELLRIIEKRKLNVLYSTPDRVVRWWLARSASRIEKIRLKDNRLSFTVSSPESNLLVKIPAGKKVEKASQPLKFKVFSSHRWAFLTVPRGCHQIKVEFADS